MAHNRTTAGASLLLRDLRNPAEPMRSFTVKLPADLIEALDQHAAAHRAPRSTLARTLLAQGVEQLETAS
jgi:metal-responsive CopG/Arc/MetJ family transcriptional regulator